MTLGMKKMMASHDANASYHPQPVFLVQLLTLMTLGVKIMMVVMMMMMLMLRRYGVHASRAATS